MKKRHEKTALVTGCLGNLGVALTKRLIDNGYFVNGIDNNARSLLGAEGDVRTNLKFLNSENVVLVTQDISKIDWKLYFPDGYDVIVHCAGQVSHPKSIETPYYDWEVNATGTVRLLEYLREVSPGANFIFIGSAKIYGQNVDEWPLPYVEGETRYWYSSFEHVKGVNENCSFDQTMKTPFGVSKAAADLATQEYAYTYGLQTSVLRPGVFTGKYAKPVIYQNWVGDLVKEVLTQDHVDIIGWKGKQVRDVLHTEDLVDAIMLMIEKPPPKGSVYNIGGGMDNAVSLLEAFDFICRLTMRKPTLGFKPTRPGDWQVYVTDNSKFMKEYPKWKVTRNLADIFLEAYDQLKCTPSS